MGGGRALGYSVRGIAWGEASTAQLTEIRYVFCSSLDVVRGRRHTIWERPALMFSSTYIPHTQIPQIPMYFNSQILRSQIPDTQIPRFHKYPESGQ